MADLIDRQAAKEAVKYIPWCDWKAVGDCLDELPASDAVEVVRCKDCRHSDTIDNTRYCFHWARNTDDNGFCHEGV